MDRPSVAEARTLARLAWRTSRQSVARSLLVVALIALVVAVGAGMMAIGSSSVTGEDDLQRRALADARIAFAFSSDGLPRFQPGFDLFDGGFVGPAPIPGTFFAFEDEDVAAQSVQTSVLDWNATFDADTSIAAIEAALSPPTSLRYTRAIAPSWSQAQICPFGCPDSAGVLLDVSAFDPIEAGQMVLLDGRLPNRPGEVARDLRRLDGEVGSGLGDTIRRDGLELTIVGAYGGPSDYGSPFDLVLAEDFDLVAAAHPDAVVDYRLYPEPGWEPDDRLASMRAVSEIVDQSAFARTADELLVPVEAVTPEWVSRPAVDFSSGANATEARVLPTLATVLLSVQVAFVAAAALAVAVRRRSRQYALVGVAGGSPTHVRGLVFAEALLLGVTGAALGIVVAAIAIRFFPYEAPLANGWTWGVVELGAVDALVPAVIGVGAALLAAWWPAHTVATSPTTALLGGRLPSRRPGAPTLWRAASLLAIGSVMTVLLAFQLANATAGSSLLPLLALAILAMLGGAALVIGPVLAWVGRRADRLPLLARLVARDSDRGRTRSWVAIGALMVLTMIPVLFGAATKAYPNSFGDNSGELDRRLVTVRSQQRWWGPPGEEPPAPTPDQLASYERIDAAIGDALADVGTVVSEVELVDIREVHVVVRRTEHWTTSSGDPVIVATPSLADALRLDTESRQALRAGAVLDVGRHAIQPGTVALERQGRAAISLPVDVVRGPIYLSSGVLVAPDHPITAAVEPEVSGTIRVLADELSLDAEVAVRRAGNEAWDAAFADETIAAESLRFGPAMDLRIEQSWSNGPDASTVQFWSLVASGALSLVIAALMAALSAVELDRDLSSMVAAGAPPGLRRRFLGVHTLYHMVLAAMLGVPLAVLLYWLATRADDFGPSGPTVPWTIAGIVIVVIPLAVALFVSLVFRNGRPATSRRMT